MATKYWVLLAIGIGLVALYIIPSPVSDLVDDLTNTAIDKLVEFTSTDEDRLAQLEDDTQVQVVLLIQDLKNQGIDVKVGQTLRTPAQEKNAIDSGHSAVKTHSWHELGRAVDLYPIDPDTGSADLNGKRDDLFVAMQQAAQNAGFRQIAYDSNWNRRFINNSAGKKIWDGGHMEWRGDYATIAEAVAAEGSNYGIT